MRAVDPGVQLVWNDGQGVAVGSIGLVHGSDPLLNSCAHAMAKGTANALRIHRRPRADEICRNIPKASNPGRNNQLNRRLDGPRASRERFFLRVDAFVESGDSTPVDHA